MTAPLYDTYHSAEYIERKCQEAVERYKKEEQKKIEFMKMMQGDVENQLDTMLKSSFRNAYDKLQRVGPPRITLDRPMMQLDYINSVLENLKVAVYNSFCRNEYIPGNIINDVLNRDVTLLYGSISEKIAYGIVIAASNNILGHMLYYLDKSFIFSYIKDRIVRPTIAEDVQKLRTRLQSENSLSKEQSLNSRRSDLLVSFVNELMIGMDYPKAAEILEDINKYGLDFETAREFLDLFQVFVPNFVYDLFSPDTKTQSLAADAMADFLNKYIVTFTHEGVTDLFRGYTRLGNDFMSKVEDTLLQREKLHNLFGLDLVDGLTLTELKLANKLCKLAELTEDEENIVKSTPKLTNIRNAIDMYKEFDTKVKLDGSTIIITSSMHEPRTIYYTKDDMMNKLSDPFNIFGKDREYVRTTLKFKPLESCLTQTALTGPERRRIFYTEKPNSKLMTVEGRIEDRNHKINYLMNKLEQRDPNLVREARELLEKGPSKLVFINPYQNEAYENLGDERSILLLLCETEGLYRKIVNYKEPINIEEKIKPRKTLQEAYDDIRERSRVIQLGYPPTRKKDSKGVTPSPLYAANIAKFKQPMY